MLRRFSSSVAEKFGFVSTIQFPRISSANQSPSQSPVRFYDVASDIPYLLKRDGRCAKIKINEIHPRFPEIATKYQFVNEIAIKEHQQ